MCASKITNIPYGTRSIVRTVQLVKLVAERGQIGWRLTDLATQCGLGKSTVFRILSCLTAQRMIRQRTTDRRYVAGPLLYELSLALPMHSGFKDVVHAHLEDIARRIKAVAFLHLLAGDEVICIDRAGTTTTQPLTGIGTRRPILQSTFGISMLLAMSPSRQREMLSAEVKGAGKRSVAYRRILNRSKQYGYGVHIDDVLPGLTISVPILEKSGEPIASIGITMADSKAPESRIKSVAEFLQDRARRIEKENSDLIAELRGRS